MNDIRSVHLSKALFTLIVLGILAALFVNMGVNALYLEEPRRCLVGLEMDYNDNLIVPTYYGEYYYKKPPVFNWAVLGSFKLFGITEWAARFVTVISLMCLGLINYLFVKRHVSERLARFSSLLLVCNAVNFFFMSMFAEIDMFFSMVCYAGLISFYHFHKLKKPFLMFASLYGIGAIALLTKGLPAVPLIGLTMVGFLIWKRNWRQVFGLAHLSGMLVFAVVVGGYLLAYSQYNGLENYWDGVWGDASGRTMVDQSWLRLLRHLIIFPFATLLDIAPAGLFALLLLRRGAWKRLFADETMAFCGVAWLANFILYWTAPGTKGIYVLMLNPFLVILCVQLFLNEAPSLPWLNKLLHGFNVFCLGVVTLFMVAAPFLPYFAPVSGLWWQSLIFTLGMGGVWWLWRKTRGQSLAWLVMALVVGRLAFDVVVLPMRAWDGRHTRFKADAEKIVKLSGDKHVRIWKYKDQGTFAHHFTFYIERGKGEVLRFTEEKNCTDYFLDLERDIDPKETEVVHRFKNWNHDYVMFRWKNCGED